jgi:hypothetical protein
VFDNLSGRLSRDLVKSTSRPRYKNKKGICGEVCRIILRVIGLDEKFDGEIRELSSESEDELRAKIRNHVMQELGEDFD